MADAIVVENLGKKYRLAAGGERSVRYRTLRESLAAAATAPFRQNRRRPAAEDFWALKDVSFEVKPGEVVGIIGRNGAGKSTLLKILSRITKPTAGRVEIGGRVGSLLEVGTGFHPELTGRENVYLNGSILGMTRREIARKFDEIVAFAEVERFLDTPVKRYSSGMYVRLAFAVAAHLEPEILIVDEVLAVGDAEFQRKCLGRMESIGRSGRTVLFVSHNLHAVASLTDRCVLLAAGSVVGCGPSGEVIDQYLGVGGGAEAEWVAAGGPAGPGRIRAIRARAAGGRVADRFAADEPFDIEFECEFAHPVDAQLAFRLNSDRGCETVFTSALSDAAGVRTSRFPAGRTTARCRVPGHLLPPGTYHVLAALNTFRGPALDLVERALALEVTEVGALGRFDNRLGAVAPLLPWTVLTPEPAAGTARPAEATV